MQHSVLAKFWVNISYKISFFLEDFIFSERWCWRNLNKNPFGSVKTYMLTTYILHVVSITWGCWSIVTTHLKFNISLFTQNIQVFCVLRYVDHKCFSDFRRIVIPLSLASKIKALLRNVGDQSTKCNFSEEWDFQKRRCENLKSPNLEVNKIKSQIYVSIKD